MDAPKSAENVNDNDSVRPKCEEDAAKCAVDRKRMVLRQASRKRMQMTKQEQPTNFFLKKMSEVRSQDETICSEER